MAVTEEEKQLREAVRASELTAADEERRRLQRQCNFGAEIDAWQGAWQQGRLGAG